MNNVRPIRPGISYRSAGDAAPDAAGSSSGGGVGTVLVVGAVAIGVWEAWHYYTKGPGAKHLMHGYHVGQPRRR